MSDLDRFVAAQEGVYDRALAELRSGRKRSHWMWFVFPQLAGLGHSPTAAFYGIESLAHACAYLVHPLLGLRLREISAVVAALDDPPGRVFGSVDALKLRSSMTLFHRADPSEPVFAAVLQRHYGGVEDAATIELLSSSART